MMTKSNLLDIAWLSYFFISTFIDIYYIFVFTRRNPSFQYEYFYFHFNRFSPWPITVCIKKLYSSLFKKKNNTKRSIFMLFKDTYQDQKCMAVHRNEDTTINNRLSTGPKEKFWYSRAVWPDSGCSQVNSNDLQKLSKHKNLIVDQPMGRTTKRCKDSWIFKSQKNNRVGNYLIILYHKKKKKKLKLMKKKKKKKEQSVKGC